jgi:hypothetical protein
MQARLWEMATSWDHLIFWVDGRWPSRYAKLVGGHSESSAKH